jgi:transcriptional regulator with XRE-family HTH domain
MKVASFGELIEEAKKRDAYGAAAITLEFTEGLFDLMQSNSISPKELAKRVGTSEAYVTKVLRGDINLTIGSMVKLAKAAGGTIRVQVE